MIFLLFQIIAPVTSCNLPSTNCGFNVRFTFKAFALLYRSVLFMHPLWDQLISLPLHSIPTVYTWVSPGDYKQLYDFSFPRLHCAHYLSSIFQFWVSIIFSGQKLELCLSWSVAYFLKLHERAQRKKQQGFAPASQDHSSSNQIVRLLSLRVWGACELP